MAAAGMGWDCYSMREVAGHSHGALPHVSTFGRHEAMQRALAEIVRWIPSLPTLIVWTALESLLESSETSSAANDAARAMLLAEDVLPIVIRPDADTLDSWHRRQVDQIGAYGTPAATNQPSVVQHSLRQVIQVLSSRPAKSYLVLDVTATLPWHPSTGSAQYFEDPRIGDIRVRAAYQLSYLLLRGRLPETNIAPTDFVESSVLATFEDALRQSTGAVSSEQRKTALRHSPQ